jgi:DNA-binding NarL/FixJ family response regulator
MDRTLMNQQHPIRVLIVGNHDLLRESLSNLMSIQPDMELVGTVLTNRDAIEQAVHLKPDVALIDLSISEMESLIPIQHFHQAFPHIPIIATSGFPRRNLVENMINAGVKRFIKRGDAAISIVSAIREVCQ